MAEKVGNFEMNNFSSSLGFFEECIRFILSKCLTDGDCTLRGNLCKFGALLKSKMDSKRKKSGDLIVSLLDVRINLQEQEALKERICQSSALNQYLVSGNVDQYSNIHFYIDRKIFIKNVFQMVITSGPTYGQKRSPTMVNQEYLVNGVNILVGCNGEDELTIGQLRTTLLCNHLVEILQQNRCPTQKCGCLINVSLEKSRNISTNNLLEDFGMLKHDMQPVIVSPKKLEPVDNILKSNLLKSKYRTEDTDVIKDSELDCNEISKTDCSRKLGECFSEDGGSRKIGCNSLFSSGKMCFGDRKKTMNLGNCLLNLEKFLEELKTFEHNKGDCVAYGKNLKDVHVMSIWDDICYLEMIANETQLQNDKDSRIIHVCGQDKQFQLQKVALTWRMLTERKNVAEKQVFLYHGSVAFHEDKLKSRRNKNVSVVEFQRIRTKQVKHSYFMKYGPIVNDQTWAATITKMAISVIKLEILLTPLKTQMKLEVTDSNECPPSCRQALFVLYNCARLAKIMEHYDNAVEKGVYPPLPDIIEIDFSLLKDEAEWNLLMKYIVSYPDIVANVAQSLQDAVAVAKFNSNKIALFLVSLSQDISVYYSRVHILGEPRAHLLPIMFARLYLVKVLRQVIQNALQLVNIDSIDQM